MPVFLFAEVAKNKTNKNKMYRKHDPATNSTAVNKIYQLLFKRRSITTEGEEF